MKFRKLLDWCMRNKTIQSCQSSSKQYGKDTKPLASGLTTTLYLLDDYYAIGRSHPSIPVFMPVVHHLPVNTVTCCNTRYLLYYWVSYPLLVGDSFNVLKIAGSSKSC